MSKEASLNITELADAFGETPRQIRYLIAEGFIPAPGGSRTKPEYGDEHVAAIARYKTLRRDYRPGQIKVLLDVERQVAKGGPITLVPGVTLTILPDLLRHDTEPRAVGDLAAAALENVLKIIARENTDAA